MIATTRIGQWLHHFLAAVGLITILVLFTPAVSWWARACSGPLRQPKGDVLIVLSAANDDEGTISYSSYWRARDAIVVWRRGGFSRIVVSRGTPGILDFLTAYGVPREAIFAEKQASSTHQSAVETARLIQNLPGRRVLLTSDFHIYRALHAFRKAGIQATPFAVPDVLHSTEHWQGRFSAFETMTTESVKIVYYWLRGWI